MAYCKKCGAYMTDDSKFCQTCGATVEQPQQSYQQPQQNYQQPQQSCQPAPATPAAAAAASPVLGIGTFIGAILLSGVPIVGFVFLIVWACGGCQNRNLRNYAIASLIIMAAVVVLTVVIVLLFGVSFATLFSNLENFN